MTLITWPTTDLDRVLFFAGTQVNVTECPPNTNTGLKVEEYQSVVGLKKGDAWCAAWVSWAGTRAIGSRWPLVLTGGCQTLFEKSTAKGWVVDQPKVGAVFLLWFPKLDRFAHTGFIEKAGEKTGEWVTLEGNTSGAGSRDGWGVFRRTRKFAAADRFVVWDR